MTVLSVHHAGIVVADLDRAVRFYTEDLGGRCEVVLRDLADPATNRLQGFPDDTRYSIAFVAFSNARVEFIEFGAATHGVPGTDPWRDPGLQHLAFQVEDVHAEVARLAGRGVAFAHAPVAIPDGVAAGTVIAFCRDPEGTRLELFQPGPGLGG